MNGSRPVILFLGGNGHCTARLQPAQAVLTQQGALFHLQDIPYPGFEGRLRAPGLDQFLDTVSASVTAARGAGLTLLYGTGIGGLLALGLRARGEHLDLPLLLQGPVLWGLKTRLFPRLMRLGFARWLQPMFGWSVFQAWFVRRKFLRPPASDMQQAFFRGYAQCSAASDFFAWLTPAYLRQLEEQFRLRPQALEGIQVWWGDQDQVVSVKELRFTERALKTAWPLRRFPHWGHYPMIDDPDEWVKELADVVADPGSFS